MRVAPTDERQMTERLGTENWGIGRQANILAFCAGQCFVLLTQRREGPQRAQRSRNATADGTARPRAATKKGRTTKDTKDTKRRKAVATDETQMKHGYRR